MRINLRPHQQASNHVSETVIVPVVPSDPVELSKMFSMVRERLLHPRTAMQVYRDTLLLTSLTGEQLLEGGMTPLIYARRRLAVLELGVWALLHFSPFPDEHQRRLFEKLDRERALWDDRVLEFFLEEENVSGARKQTPFGILPPDQVK